MSKVAKEQANLQFKLGNQCAKSGNFDEAIRYYQKALELDPAFAKACNNLGVALKKKGQLKQALVWFSKAIELCPNFAEAYNNLGNVYALLGETTKAARHYETALRLKPNYPEALNNLGAMYLTLGKVEKALECFERSGVPRSLLDTFQVSILQVSVLLSVFGHQLSANCWSVVCLSVKFLPIHF